MIVKDEEERPSAFSCDMSQVWKMFHLSIQQEKAEQTENPWLSLDPSRELKSPRQTYTPQF